MSARLKDSKCFMLMESSRTSGAMYLSRKQAARGCSGAPRPGPGPGPAHRAYLLVPTRWLGAMSMVSVAESWRTARPKSAMQHVPFFFTRMFLDLRSL